MSLLRLLILPALLVAPGAAGAAEKRCGWLINPTPGNWWLLDRDIEWTLATQGQDGAEGMDVIPDMNTRGWVRTNGSYGHGCACMNVTTDRATETITRVFSAEPRPLRQCRADRRLPRMK